MAFSFSLLIGVSTFAVDVVSGYVYKENGKVIINSNPGNIGTVYELKNYKSQQDLQICRKDFLEECKIQAFVGHIKGKLFYVEKK